MCRENNNIYKYLCIRLVNIGKYFILEEVEGVERS